MATTMRQGGGGCGGGGPKFCLLLNIHKEEVRLARGCPGLLFILKHRLDSFSGRVDLFVQRDNRIKQRRAWLVLGWVAAERSCPCKQPACPPPLIKPIVPKPFKSIEKRLKDFYFSHVRINSVGRGAAGVPDPAPARLGHHLPLSALTPLIRLLPPSSSIPGDDLSKPVLELETRYECGDQDQKSCSRNRLPEVSVRRPSSAADSGRRSGIFLHEPTIMDRLQQTLIQSNIDVVHRQSRMVALFTSNLMYHLLISSPPASIIPSILVARDTCRVIIALDERHLYGLH
ncbi:hypothetical protein J6590_009138 [Homalodisca vitripennis]|nr:hypothetical protein J6590_009138 [Homalodisca vitripennis]